MSAAAHFDLDRLRRAVDAGYVKWWLFPNFKWPDELEKLRPEIEDLLEQMAAVNQKLEPLGLGFALDPYVR